MASTGPHSRGRKWFVRSKSIDEKWFPKDYLDNQSRSYDILFKNASDDRFMSTIEGDSWFDAYGAEQIQIGEQSFRTHVDEVVTLLVAKSLKMLAD